MASYAGSSTAYNNSAFVEVSSLTEKWTCQHCVVNYYVRPSVVHYCPRSGLSYHVVYKEIHQKEETTNMDIAKRLRELKLSKADKLLYKHGLITESGQLTETGRSIVLDQAFALVRDFLVADLEKLEAEDKKK